MRQALAHDRRQNFGWILQHPRRADDPAGRYVDADVEVTKVVVELRVSEIRIGVPSAVAQIVEDSYTGIPLRDLIQRVCPASHPKPTRAFNARNLEAPIGFDCASRVSSDRSSERNTR